MIANVGLLILFIQLLIVEHRACAPSVTGDKYKIDRHLTWFKPLHACELITLPLFYFYFIYKIFITHIKYKRNKYQIKYGEDRAVIYMLWYCEHPSPNELKNVKQFAKKFMRKDLVFKLS